RLVHCDECALPCSIDKRETKRDKTKVEMSCPVHGGMKKEIPSSLEHLLDSVVEAVSEGSLFRSMLRCKNCGNPLSIRVVEAAKDGHKFKGSCMNNHTYELVQQIQWSEDATDAVTKAVLKCNQCNLFTDIIERKVDGAKAEIEVICPIHGPMKKGLTAEVLMHVDEQEPKIDRTLSNAEIMECVQCNTPIILKDIKLHRSGAEAKIECLNGHGDTRFIVLGLNPERLIPIYSRLFECHRCKSPMDLMQVTTKDDKSKLVTSCAKHGSHETEIPSAHVSIIRDAYVSTISPAKLQSIVNERLPNEDACSFQLDPNADIQEMMESVKSVIEQHDVRFIEEKESEGEFQAWYFGKALLGDEFALVGIISPKTQEIVIRAYSNHEEKLGTLMAHLRENLREVLLRIQSETEDLQPLRIECTHCGAALRKRGLPGETTNCEHCGTPLHW
ncbi:MAG: hypothetical protein ACFE7R_04060, partial [Candidatus Hodarchaeota archaeon]